ncbi:unnamed protein product [Mytilus coruscus]|uniref:SRCR domain-containing protein n=1 Tax=Mytilus coruscus TaxID=42192 RepID=A0A6J8DLV3_MYTCO|nr:unnamed protein product [Mytilus coruscus]
MAQVFIKGEIHVVNIFCELDDDHLSINCPAKKTVELQDVTHDESECKENSDEDVCTSDIFTNLKTYCVGNNNCSIPSSNLANENCRRTPRNIAIQYSCNYRWTDFGREMRSKVTCTSDLSEINCNHNFWRIRIKINSIALQTEHYCSTCDKRYVEQSLSNLCNNKKVCSSPENDNMCLFHQRYIKVTYWCKDETDILPEGSTAFEDTVTSTSSNFNNNTTYVSFTSSVFETSSHTTTETTLAPEEQPSIAIDLQGRVLINAGNTNFTICSFKWDDNDANVICRSISNTSMGKAKQMHGYNQNTTIPIDFYCIGNETGLDVCKRSFNYDECNILTVAAVICCNDDGTSEECSNIIAPRSSSDFNVGKFCYRTCYWFVAACRDCDCNFDIHKKVWLTVGDEESNVISHTEYAVVDPIKRIESPFNLEFDNNTGNDYLVLDPNETGFNSLDGPPSTTGSYELAKPIEDSGYRKDKKGMETNSDNLYACSEDGVYDSAHGNGYTESESNVYSHTVDNVYDSSIHTKKNAETEDNYDHFTGKKTQDDYDISK